MRFRVTIDIQRAHYYTPPPAPESAPDVDSKGAFILDRAPAHDFEDQSKVGFCRNEER